MAPPPIPGLNPVYEDYARCVHCGLCLNACPTYRLWNLEGDSPRGRIHQMIHVELNQQPITDSFVDHIGKCLDCRACETACPSGVEYGKLVEHARARIERDYPRSWLARVTRNFVFRHLLPDPHRIIDAAPSNEAPQPVNIELRVARALIVDQHVDGVAGHRRNRLRQSIREKRRRIVLLADQIGEQITQRRQNAVV